MISKKDFVLGIIGGGQLGKMLLQYCNELSITTYVYDSSEFSPCKNICCKFFKGELQNYEKIVDFASKCDIVTYEIEHINVAALKYAESCGIKVYPTSETLETIQNKSKQKLFFEKNQIPTSNFRVYSNLETLNIDIQNSTVKMPFVWKKTTEGYDGYGVKIIKTKNDLHGLRYRMYY